MKYDRKNALKIIVEAAKQYEQKLNNCNFLIVYQQEGNIENVQIGFRNMYFLHLTGVRTKLSAQRFYEKALHGKLSVHDFELDKVGKVQRKLEVLPYLHEMLYHNCMIGNYIDSGILIQSDYFVGNTKAVLSVGFRYGKTVDIPVTLYKEDVRKLVNPVCRVLAIFKKIYSEDMYSTCTYLAKNQKIEEMKLPVNIDLEKIRKLP